MNGTVNLSRLSAVLTEMKADPVAGRVFAGMYRDGSAKLIARCDIMLKDPELTEVEFDNIRAFRAGQIAKHGEPDPRAMMDFIEQEYVPILADSKGWKMEAARSVYSRLAAGGET